MIKVGLTGGIGTGKSTVSNMFRERKIPIVDADIVAREVLKLYPEILSTIKGNFGKEFFDSKGDLLRREFGDYIFKNTNKRKEYENIIMPFIKKEIFKRIDFYKNKSEKICILDAPTLIENGVHKYMDFNILVWADKNTQIDRVKKRDKFNDEEALNRIKAQMPLEEKKEIVDFVIDNSKDLKNTKAQVNELIGKLNNI
ncbi:dephospho-CoA kinase [Clostridium acetireducens DSM 10703]|jgi:dephospho-CoA kinase|uniref:Dephospho-CoA kinase n=1 Tax=Clostridium acetireducens DSM 10703 TaxID=1121290 RepID=A0A1E8F196_9CLOT|nr:dephospho-CoA kinase [Clostridium acetireducens]OFI07237.1 dephospho-CoA kinase [Clostridium acetireducens DSM 10703]